MRVLARIPALMLISCGNGHVANKAEPGSTALQPGRWEMVAEEPMPDGPGAPPGAQGGETRTDLVCMTVAEAADPTNALLGLEGGGETCQVSDRTVAGGVMRLRAACDEGADGRMEWRLDARYTATTFEGTIIMTAPGAPGAQPMRMTQRIRGRRVGDCQAGR